MLRREKKIHSAEYDPFYQSIPGNGLRKNATMPLLLLATASSDTTDTGGHPVMKLHATSTQQYQTITAYDDNGVEINAVPYRKSRHQSV